MNMMSTLIAIATSMMAFSAAANAQTRYYSRPSSSTTVYSYPTTVVRAAPQAQTVAKPVVATPAATIATPASKATPIKTVSATKSNATVNAVGSIEAEIVAHTNAQRARYGLPPLAICPNLMNSARQHCSWMASANSLSHTRAAVAENIAAGQNSPAEAMNSWMNSSGHRANILGGGYSTIGVAAFTGSNGQTYWCQQFR
jgi:uncharacterized protein YkwD